MTDTAVDVTERELRELFAQHAGPPYPQLRPRRRRIFVTAVMVAAAVAAVASPAFGVRDALERVFFRPAALPAFGGSTTLHVDWRESMAMHDGRLSFRVTRIDVSPAGYRVRASVTNHASYPVRVVRSSEFARPIMGKRYVFRTPGFAVTYRGGLDGPDGKIDTAFIQEPATRFSPALPRRLAAGQTWSGTFAGDARLPRDRTLYLQFALFVPVGVPAKTTFTSINEREGGYTWITDHTFTLG